METKPCVVCGEPFPAIHRRSTCSIACRRSLERQRNTAWRRANPDKVKEYVKRYLARRSGKGESEADS